MIAIERRRLNKYGWRNRELNNNALLNLDKNMAKIIRTVRYVRGPVGKIVKWLFIGFNLFMAFWLFSYWGDVAPMMNDGSSAAQAGAAIGSTIGTGMILMIWVLGAIVLGIPVLLTKGKRVEIEETPEGLTLAPASQDSVNISQEALQKQAEVQPYGSDDWNTKFKTGFEALVRYAMFIVCFVLGLALLSSGSAVLGIGFTILGLIFLPQIKQAMAEKTPNKPAMKILAVVGVIALLTYIGASDSPSRKMASLQEKVVQAQVEQTDLKEEAEKTFAENPDKVLQQISSHAENKNWQAVKIKTEILLGAENSEIKKLYDKAVSELIKEEEEKQKQAQEHLAKEAAEVSAGLWSYSENDDPMSKGKTYYASILSSNTVQFDFPYSGTQHGTLTLRTDPKYGKDVIFSIEKGQILCSSYDGCTVRVRFDDEDAASYSAAGAADNSTEAIFIQNYGRFVEKMIKAKRVRISMNVYQEGSPVFDFDVSGFNVNKYKPKSQ